MFVEAAGELSSYSRTAFPSGVSISADGQILVLTHAYLHILTPALGPSIRADSSALPGYPGNKPVDQWHEDKGSEAFQPGECPGLTMYKTSISATRRAMEWEDYTADSRLTTPGGLENGWRMASWSPSGLSEAGWCLLATLSINGEVVIYAPGNDAIRSAWQEIFDLTAAYAEHIHPAPFEPYHASQAVSIDEQKAARDKFTMQAQNTSISWSSAGPEHSTQDESLLAVGHKSGHVTLWRYDPPGTMKLMLEYKVSDQAPVILSWSAWTTTGAERPHATLAVAASHGPVYLLRVSLSSDGTVDCTLGENISPSNKLITMLKWINDTTLIIGRLNEVTLWHGGVCATLSIPIEDFRGWTSMANPLDCVELPESRSLLIAMHDGTLRTILRDDNEASPRLSTLEDPREANDSSLALCESLRTSFRIIEKTGNRSKNKASLPVTAAMLMSGFAQLDTMGTVFLAYEKHLLDRKLYVMPNTRYSHFALARIDNDGLEQKIMQATTKALKQDSSTGSSTSSAATIFPILLALRHLSNETGFLKALRDLIKSNIEVAYAPSIQHQSEQGYLELLRGDPKVQALRLASLLTSHIATNATDDNLKASCRDLNQQITLSIYLLVFRALEGLLRVASSSQSLLMARYTKVVTNLEAAQSGTMDIDGSGQGEPEVFATELDEAERCAACQEAIPFSQLGRGICRNGHVWTRCSITLSVMFTASARACTVCGRKSQVSKPLTVELDEEQELGNKLLAAAKHCVFCGGRWSGARA